MIRIASPDNQWLKRFRAALRGTGPEADGPIALEGFKLIEEALRSGLEAEAVLLSESGESQAASLLAAAADTEAGIPRSRLLRTTDKLFRGVAGTDHPQGIAALFRQRSWTLEDVLRGSGTLRVAAPLVLVLAAVQDPGNVGTIVRSAEAFGATGVVATRGTADPWSPKAIRASAGSALRLPLLRGMAVPILLAQLRFARLKIYASKSQVAAHHGAAAEPTDRADFREAAAIFVGNEGTGLAPEIERAADAVLSIPTNSATESLNAGVAASILLYEAARQRQPSVVF